MIKHKREMMGKNLKIANMVNSVNTKSCNRLLIGKTYWKNIALPAILYGSNIINVTESEVEELQRIENSVG